MIRENAFPAEVLLPGINPHTEKARIGALLAAKQPVPLIRITAKDLERRNGVVDACIALAKEMHGSVATLKTHLETTPERIYGERNVGISVSQKVLDFAQKLFTSLPPSE